MKAAASLSSSQGKPENSTNAPTNGCPAQQPDGGDALPRRTNRPTAKHPLASPQNSQMHGFDPALATRLRSIPAALIYRYIAWNIDANPKVPG